METPHFPKIFVHRQPTAFPAPQQLELSEQFLVFSQASFLSPKDCWEKRREEFSSILQAAAKQKQKTTNQTQRIWPTTYTGPSGS
mmetsp:Transcript_6340/g.10925  ORF Transcript_6340/g.10925 Transcript_6340/m.10925 type:complete len:85 (-) Transcript_6340:88-342(-)